MLLPSFVGAAVGFLSLTSLAIAAPQPQGQAGFGGSSGSSGQGEDGSESTSTVVGGASSATLATSTTAASGATTVSLAAAATGTTACNNSPELCNRNYNNITHMGVHDAAFLRDSADDFTTSGNQYYNATVALSAGMRLLQAQVHNLDGTLELCHTSCDLLDAGSLEDWLADVKYWMDNNANEVVTILLVNSDSNSTDSFGAAFNGSGISDYGYTPSSTDAAISTWPTLATLIAANTRLVSFVTNINYTTSYPFLLPEFTYIFETAFTVTSLSDFNCDLNRPSTESSAATAISAGFMGLANHFADTAELGSIDLTIPDVTDIETTNSDSTDTTGALGLHGANCTSEWGIKPTFMLVDFWNVGPAITTADNLNGIMATGRTNVSTAIVTAATSAAPRGRGDISGSWSILMVALGVFAIVNAAL